MPFPRFLRPLAALPLALGLVAPAVAQDVDIGAMPLIRAPFPEGEFRVAPPDTATGPVNEAIQGKPNFRKVVDLSPNDPNYKLGQKVGQLWLVTDKGAAPLCTGFLVAEQLFLTNYHCAADYKTGVPKDPRTLAVAMEHLEQGKVGPKDSISGVVGVLKLDFRLDYALLFLGKPLGKKYGYLSLERDPQRIADVKNVKIIQHPAGRSKEIVLEDTQMVKQTALEMHYLADTEGGSSGSPVFALDGERVIGLHHAGWQNKYNEGLIMARIAAEIALYLPPDQQQADAPVASAAQSAAGAASETPAPANPLGLLLTKPAGSGAGQVARDAVPAPATAARAPAAQPTEQPVAAPSAGEAASAPRSPSAIGIEGNHGIGGDTSDYGGGAGSSGQILLNFD